MTAILEDEIHDPDSDGEPAAESELHFEESVAEHHPRREAWHLSDTCSAG